MIRIDRALILIMCAVCLVLSIISDIVTLLLPCLYVGDFCIVKPQLIQIFKYTKQCPTFLLHAIYTIIETLDYLHLTAVISRHSGMCTAVRSNTLQMTRAVKYISVGILRGYSVSRVPTH